jgi:uncharacterized delta-60 repeat protein
LAMSETWAAVTTMVWTSLLSRSVPMWAFMPKCRWLPLRVWCISGSRFLSLFLVEGEAAMNLASTSGHSRHRIDWRVAPHRNETAVDVEENDGWPWRNLIGRVEAVEIGQLFLDGHVPWARQTLLAMIAKPLRVLFPACAFCFLTTVAGQAVDRVSQDKSYGGKGWADLPSSQVAIQGGSNLICSRVTDNLDGIELTRYKGNGLLDTSFGNNGTSSLSVAGTPLIRILNLGDPVIQGDGKIVLPGTVDYNYAPNSSTPYMVNVMAVWRFTATGQPDQTFNGTGYALWNPGNTDGGTHYSTGNHAAVQPDGKIVVAGTALGLAAYYSPQAYYSGNDLTVWRFLPDGTLDTTFNGRGYRAIDPYAHPSSNVYTEDSVNEMKLRPNGEIIVGFIRSSSISGSSPSWGYESISATGTSHQTFEDGSPASLQIRDIFIQPDNKVIIGRSGDPRNFARNFSMVLRTTATNTLDPTFPKFENDSLYPNAPLSGFQITFFLTSQALYEGKLIVAGHWENTINGIQTGYFSLLRINSDGTLDSSFHNGSHIYSEAGNWVNKILTQADGSMIVITTGENGFAARKYKSGPPVTQHISFTALGNKTYGDAPFSVSATASSGLPVTLSIVSGPAAIAGNAVTLTGAGAVTVRATQAGNDIYAPAPSVERSFTVAKASQTLTVPPVVTRPFSKTPLPLKVTSSSGMPVSYSLISGPATVSGSSLLVSGPGTIKVRATQAGNGNFLPASPLEVIFTITPNISTPANLQFSAGWVYDTATIVGQLSSLDADAGDLTTYSLVSGSGDTDNDKFTIFGNFLQLEADSLNYDEQHSVSIRVRATDLAGHGTEKIFILTVVDSNPYAKFRFKGGSTLAPCYVNAIFQLADEYGRGINLPKALIDQDKTLFSITDNDSEPLNAIDVRNSDEAFAQISKLETVPTTVKTVLVIDQSQSIGLTNLAKAREAAKALVDSIFPQQEIAVYAFSEGAVLKKGFSRDKASLKAAIDSISSLSGTTTDLNGTIHNLLSPTFRNPDSSTSPNPTYWSETFTETGINTGFLVVFTDGDDQAARRTTSEVQGLRNSSGKTVHIVGLLKPTETEANKQKFRDKWAELANGLAVSVDNVDDLGAKFKEVQDDIQNSANSYYWLNYASPRRSANRSFTVRLKNNINSNSDRQLTIGYDASKFTSLEAGVFINRSFTGEADTSLTMTLGSTRTVIATSLFGDPAKYTWSLGDPSLGTLNAIDGNAARVSLTVANTNATTTLKVTDTVNGYSRNIPLIIGTGASSVSTLSKLVANGTSLSPGFTAGTMIYTTKVPNSTKSIKITPTAKSASAKISINEVAVKSGMSSNAVSLKVGKNAISIVVTAQNGSKSTYKITVIRATSSVSTLSKLVANGTTLSPAFTAGTMTYRTKVPNSTKSMRITPTAKSTKAKISINGVAVKTGTISKAIGLKVGTNIVKIVVTAQNGSKRTYKITVTRAAAASSSVSPSFLLAVTGMEGAGGLATGQSLAVTSVERIGGLKYLAIEIRQPAGSVTTHPRVEVSPNLIDWYSGNAHTTVVEDSATLFRVRDNTPVTPERKRYIRVGSSPN